MAKTPKTVPVRVKEGFLLTRDDSSKQYYEPGPQEMPVEDAEHHYTQHFLDTSNIPKMGDFEFARLKRKLADEKKALFDEADASAREAEDAFAAKNPKQAAAVIANAEAQAEKEADDSDEEEDGDDDETDGEDDADPEKKAEEGDDAADKPAKPKLPAKPKKRPKLT